MIRVCVSIKRYIAVRRAITQALDMPLPFSDRRMKAVKITRIIGGYGLRDAVYIVNRRIMKTSERVRAPWYWWL